MSKSSIPASTCQDAARFLSKRALSGWFGAEGFLPFSLLFLAEVLCPFELSRVSSKKQGTLLTFARTEPQDGSVVLDVHHACACWEFSPAKRAFSGFRHGISSV